MPDRLELVLVERVEGDGVQLEIAQQRNRGAALGRISELVFGQQRHGGLGAESHEALPRGCLILCVPRADPRHQAVGVIDRTGVPREAKHGRAHARVAVCAPADHLLGAGQRSSVVAPGHLHERLRRVGPVRALPEPLGEQSEAAPPLLVRLRREQHRAQLLARRAAHQHVASGERLPQHRVEVGDSGGRAPASVELGDGGEPHRCLPVAQCTLEHGGRSLCLAGCGSRGEPRVGLEQIGALLGGKELPLGEQLRQRLRSPCASHAPGGQRLHEPVERVHEKRSVRRRHPLEGLGEHLGRDGRLGAGHEIERGPARARIGIGEARGQGAHGAGVEELRLVGPHAQQALLGGGLEQQARIRPPEGECRQQPESGDGKGCIGDRRGRSDRQSQEHAAVAEHAPDPVHRALQEPGRRGAQPLREEVEEHPQRRAADAVLGEARGAEGAHAGREPRPHAEPAEAQQIAGRPECERQRQADALIQPAAQPELREEHRHVEPAAELGVQGQQPLLAVGPRRSGIRHVGELEVEDGAQQTPAQQRGEQQPEENALAPQLRDRGPSLAALGLAAGPAGGRRGSLDPTRTGGVEPGGRGCGSAQEHRPHEHQPLDAQPARDRVRREAADDGAQGHAGAEGGEQALGLAPGDEVAQGEPEDQQAQGEHLARHQDEGPEHRGDLPGVEQPPERQQQQRQAQQHARKPARPVRPGERVARQARGHDEQPRARQQRPGQVGHPDALQEERLGGVEQGEGRCPDQQQAQGSPSRRAHAPRARSRCDEERCRWGPRGPIITAAGANARAR